MAERQVETFIRSYEVRGGIRGGAITTNVRKVGRMVKIETMR